MDRRGWWLVIAAASVLALVSLASNVTTLSQLAGKANTLLAGRLTLSQLVNAGAVWAGLAVVSGWLVRRPVPAVAAGVVALLTACVVHYGVGIAFGMFDPDVWTANGQRPTGTGSWLRWSWADRSDSWAQSLGGWICGEWRPALSSLPEPCSNHSSSVGSPPTPTILPWPNRVADFISGSVLLTAGVAGCVWVLAGGWRRRQALQSRRVPAEL